MTYNNENAMMETKKDFILPAMVEDDCISVDVSEDYEGLRLSFPRVKIPGGGSLQFEIPSDDPENPDYTKYIEGVILYNHDTCAYWPEGSEYDDNVTPLCSSVDGKTGYGAPGGVCATCALNQYGSVEKGKGKACKNIRRLYIMMNNRPDIYLLTVPPTSIKDVNKALKKIMGQQHIPYSRMIVTFKLNVVENADKIKYSKVTLEKTGLLPEALYKTTAELRKAMKQSYESVAITTDDYKEAAPMEATPEVGPDGFMQTGDIQDGELPFD